MQFSAPTLELLEALDALSRGTLTRREDLGALIDLAARENAPSALEELSFFAKFVSKTSRLMRRIGRGAQGYDTLERECAAALEKTGTLLRGLLAGAPADLREHLSARYLQTTPASLVELLSLCDDLAWYKNWLIDQ